MYINNSYLIFLLTPHLLQSLSFLENTLEHLLQDFS